MPQLPGWKAHSEPADLMPVDTAIRDFMKAFGSDVKLLTIPRAPKQLPATAFLRNPRGLAEWKLFLDE